MRSLTRRAWAWSLLATLLATCLFAIFLGRRQDAALEAAGRVWPLLLVVLIVSAGAAGCAIAAVHGYYRRAFHRFARDFAAFRANPTMHTMVAGLADPALRDVLGPLQEPLETLCVA